MYEFRSRRPWGLRIRTGVPALVWVLAVPMAVAAQGAPSGGADPCVPGTPFQGTSLADYWTRAIETQRMLERSRDRKEVVFESVVFDRYVPFGVDIVESEGHDWLVSTTQIPFHSPETVVDRGFMIEEREDREIVRAYYGPGLSLFEHSSFSERYCLDLVEDPRTPDRIAVRFRPVEPGSDRTEVEGAFWFEADAGGPSGMEFRYLAPEGTSIAPELHGGWVEYGVEPGGEPIVTRWQLHMPWFDGSTSEALGTHIQGGELRSTIADEDEATRVPYVWPSAIRGSVYDSLNARPLADVEIRLEGTDYTTRTDESGEFYLAQLPSGGRYRLRYVHPRLNRRAYVAQDAWVEPRSGIVLHSDLAVPSADTLFGQVCAEGSEPSTTMIAGSIVDGESGLPMPNALVYASWEEGAGTVRRIDTRADDAGAYVICGAPAGVPIALVADFLVNESLRTLVTAEAGEVELWDFFVGPTQEIDLTGTVLDAVTEQPVRDALITLVGTNRLHQTNSKGEFRFEGLDPGEYAIKVSHLAYGTEQEEVVLQPGSTSRADIRLNSTAIDLPTLTVSVESEALDIGHFETDFMDRRSRMERQGLGRFMGPEEIELLNPTSVSDIVRAIVPTAYVSGSGVLVIRSNDPGAGESVVLRRLDEDAVGVDGPTLFTETLDEGRACRVRGPVLYLDGIPIRGAGENLDRLVNPSFVRAVEVYRRASEIPAEFLDAQAECGVVAVWTTRVSGGR